MLSSSALVFPQLHSQADRHNLFLCVWNEKSKAHKSTVESGSNQVFSLVRRVLTWEVRRRGWFQTQFLDTEKKPGKIHAKVILLNALNPIQSTLASFISPNGALDCLGSSLGQACSLNLSEQMIDYSNQKYFLHSRIFDINYYVVFKYLI